MTLKGVGGRVRVRVDARGLKRKEKKKKKKNNNYFTGNWSFDMTGCPVVFDPAVSYSHSEAELGIMSMFGSVSPAFSAAYHKLIPKTPGFEDRQKLYKLYHYMNHYSIFGGSYRDSCMSIMKALLASHR